jgi:catechol 2,3-dioxygenase-like lactoylglutathione lyase family enzyme
MDHLALAVRDQERSRRFYENYLGFDVHPAHRYPDGTVMLHDADGFALALGLVDEPIRLPAFLHFGKGLRTPDEVLAFRQRLIGDGVEIADWWDEPDYVSVKFPHPTVTWSRSPGNRTRRRRDSGPDRSGPYTYPERQKR